ncbi:MAG: hypothetical protein AAF532_02700 [Planctomycetota bacterium]
MKSIRSVDAEEVYGYWREWEGVPPGRELRGDITRPLPQDVVWCRAVLEGQDASGLYLISSDDLGAISRKSFLVREAAENVKSGFRDSDHSLRLDNLLERDDGFDPRLVVVSDSIEGPFTIIEGNHRAILMEMDGTLVGQEIYLGMSSAIRDYTWARKAYR